MDKYKDYLGAITQYNALGEGSNSKVWLCDYLDYDFAYKECYTDDYRKYIKDRLYRFVDKYYDKDFVFPFKFIYKLPTDELFQGYLMDELYKYNDLYKLNGISFEKKIEILKKTRVLIEKFHNKYGCIHGDVTPFNIQYSEYQRDSVKLIDFDLNIDLKDKNNFDLKYYNWLVANYMEFVGVDKDVDIYSFNLTTLAFLNDFDYFDTLLCITDKNFGVLEDNNKAKEILSSYKDLSCKKSLKKEYVIDYM